MLLAMENQKAAEDSHNRENINSPLNNASFIDQACLVEMAGFLWTATLSWSIKKRKKAWPISSHLDPSWSIMHILLQPDSYTNAAME